MERISWKPWTAEKRRQQISTGSGFLITTFRKGTKWLRPELIGQAAEFFDEGSNDVFAHATFVAVKACRFEDIDEIDHSRQSSDMTPAARLQVMRSAYGEYDNDTLTTVVTLRVE